MLCYDFIVTWDAHAKVAQYLKYTAHITGQPNLIVSSTIEDCLYDMTTSSYNNEQIEFAQAETCNKGRDMYNTSKTGTQAELLQTFIIIH